MMDSIEMREFQKDCITVKPPHIFHINLLLHNVFYFICKHKCIYAEGNKMDNEEKNKRTVHPVSHF